METNPANERPLQRGLAALHPGALLASTVLPALKEAGVPKIAVASALGVSRVTLDDLLKEKQSLTPEMALRLAKYLGTTPDLWLNLQRAFDLERAGERIADQLAAIVPAPVRVQIPRV